MDAFIARGLLFYGTYLSQHRQNSRCVWVWVCVCVCNLTKGKL